MIRTIRPLDRPDLGLERVAKANGFSLHAGVSCEGHQKDKRERLCRYISRPAVATPRLSLSSTGKVLYTLKTPYRDGTTQVAFDRGGHPSVDFIARLAALVPKPRVNLTRFHGVLAPNHRWRGAAAGGLSKSSSSRRTVASRSRTSSPGSWAIFARRNRMSLPGPFWYRQPGRHLPRCLFSQEANSQTHISKDATEKPMARTTAGSRSGMDGYELHDHLSEYFFRAIDGYFAKFSSSVGSIRKEIYSDRPFIFPILRTISE